MLKYVCTSQFIVQTHSVQDVRGAPHIYCSQPFTVDNKEATHCEPTLRFELSMRGSPLCGSPKSRESL